MIPCPELRGLKSSAWYQAGRRDRHPCKEDHCDHNLGCTLGSPEEPLRNLNAWEPTPPPPTSLSF